MMYAKRDFTHRPVRTGALTLLITAVVICLAVLAVLALATAQADLAMAEKSLSGLQKQAQIEIAGQEKLAELDAALKNGGSLPDGVLQSQDGTIEAEVSVEDSTLQIVLQPQDPQEQDQAAYRITAWRITSQWTPDQSLDLWNGM